MTAPEVAGRMKHPLSLTPSLHHALDELTGEPVSGSITGGGDLLRTRFATDVLGLAIFFVMLGTYLTVRL